MINFKKKRLLLIGVATISLVGVTAFAGTRMTHVVDQSKLQFSEKSITVSRGDVIKFTNSDRTAHNILVQEGGMFVDSGLQQPGEPTEVPFTRPGDYKIMCAIHPKMQLDVTVEK